MSTRLATGLLLLSLLAGCGGAEVTAPPPAQIDEAEQAISIIRRSFEAMGGLERLRLAGSKVTIKATVAAGGDSFPVEIRLGGPEHYRIDYVGSDISYVYIDGACRKIAFGVSSHCTPREARWLTPVRVLVGLTFPAGDAANLRSNFRMYEPKTVAGRPCSVADIRPKNTNFKIRAAYDDGSGLLAQVDFKVRDDAGNKEPWQLTYGDWQPVKKMQVPFRRTISHRGQVVWDETTTEVDFDSYDERVFRAPVLPTTDQALPFDFPARRVSRVQVEGQAVEVLAPYPTVGGGALPVAAPELVPPMEVIRMIHRGPVKDAAALSEQLNGGALAAGRMTKGQPGVILLEDPPAEGEPALMILYVEIEPAGTGVKVEEVQ